MQDQLDHRWDAAGRRRQDPANDEGLHPMTEEYGRRNAHFTAASTSALSLSTSSTSAFSAAATRTTSASASR